MASIYRQHQAHQGGCSASLNAGWHCPSCQPPSSRAATSSHCTPAQNHPFCTAWWTNYVWTSLQTYQNHVRHAWYEFGGGWLLRVRSLLIRYTACSSATPTCNPDVGSGVRGIRAQEAWARNHFYSENLLIR
jgi:hypothetical protein